MPIKIKEMAGRLYRPSNGTEGEIFMSRFCDRCKHCETIDAKDLCDIIMRSMVFETDDKEYPQELKFDSEGRPMCTEFIPILKKTFTQDALNAEK